MTGDNTTGLAGTAVRCVGLAAGQLPMRDLSLQSRVLNSPPYPGLSELRNDQTAQRRASQVVAWVLEQTEVCFLLTGGLSGVTITHLPAKLRPGLDLTPSGKLFWVSEAWLSLHLECSKKTWCFPHDSFPQWALRPAWSSSPGSLRSPLHSSAFIRFSAQGYLPGRWLINSPRMRKSKPEDSTLSPSRCSYSVTFNRSLKCDTGGGGPSSGRTESSFKGMRTR